MTSSLHTNCRHTFLKTFGWLLSSLQPAVGKLVSLQRIMIEMNRLTVLPPELCTLPLLERLYIAYNKLTHLPDCISQLPINDLWLRGNNIATLPDTICQLTRPLSGYLMESGLTHLPACIGRVPFTDLFLRCGQTFMALYHRPFLPLMSGCSHDTPRCRAMLLLFLLCSGNALSELPDSMADIWSRRPGPFELAHNRLTRLPDWVAHATNITSINVEGNEIARIPTAAELPPNLTALRLGGNPMFVALPAGQDVIGPGDHGTAVAGDGGRGLATLVHTLASQPYLKAVSVGFGTNATTFKGVSYMMVVQSIPGISEGAPRCPSSLNPNMKAAGALLRAASCPFVIQTASFDQFIYFSTGGLRLHYCLNTTAGTCGCEQHTTDGGGGSGGGSGGPTEHLPPSCIPLVDNHDGTYSGAIDGTAVGPATRASFRFFQRPVDARGAHDPETGGPLPLEEVTIGYWGDGSACVGSTADKSFQSSGGNCFSGVEFELDCSEHGPFARSVKEAGGAMQACKCPAGWGQLAAENGQWQCAPPPAAAAPDCAELPMWAVVIGLLCLVLTLSSSVGCVCLLLHVRRQSLPPFKLSRAGGEREGGGEGGGATAAGAGGARGARGAGGGGAGAGAGGLHEQLVHSVQ